MNVERRRRVLGVAGKAKIEFAREQRSEPTRAESLLWQALRRGQLGARFRRQHAIGRFVLDFYCAAARLGVEVDGPGHADQAEYDAYRDRPLQAWGIRVLGIPEDQVREDLPGVLRTIRAALREPDQ